MLKAYPVAGKSKSRELCDAFIAGADPSAEGGVFYGVDASNQSQWQAAKLSGGAFYYLDNAWFDCSRGTHFRVARNALQIDGRGESDCNRFAALGQRMEPWRPATKRGHILVCPQSGWFMQALADESDWLDDTLEALRRMTLREVRVREWNRDKIAASRTLPDDLVGCHALVTHSSAAAVTALLAGVPIISNGAAWIMGSDLEQIESLNMPPDRLRFFGVLADNQFTLDEMRSGMAWEMLTRKVAA